MLDLGTLGEFPSSSAAGVNAAGRATGAVSDGTAQVVLWTSGTGLTDIHDASTGFNSSEAAAINGAGQIVRWLTNDFDRGHAFEFLAMLVALIGATLFAYLYTWQSNEEVEEDKASGQILLSQRQGASEAELQHFWRDVLFGAFFANLALYFIILATGPPSSMREEAISAPPQMPPWPCSRWRARPPRSCSRWGWSASSFWWSRR